ncbi:hypothetical protein [Streptomyces sviceus]|uniref:hypothetical protein n=1 Tax=Streptomyces sviceus TaxID=285530 RepID=UPI003694DEA1
MLIQKNSHVLYLDLSQPTKDFSAELWWGDCGIRKVNTVDYLSGPRQARIVETEPTDPTPSVAVTYDGWTLPKGGVVFSWVLEDELAPAHR